MERTRWTELESAFRAWMKNEERAEGTVEKYLRDVRGFLRFLEKGEARDHREALERIRRGRRSEAGSAALKAAASAWKSHLLEQGYAPVTINSMVAALNGFFRFLGMTDCRIRFLNVQRRLFRESDRELTREEYERLIRTANDRGNHRLMLLMETICATGIRVSEVKYITVEAARSRRTEIRMKGKIRVILLPEKLCRKLLRYAKKEKIAVGQLFRTGSGRGMDRRQIWAEMKALCRAAGVESSKVFPHNLRHLFARCFYHVCRDMARLADVLGHSSLETTRIYLISTGEEHAQIMEKLKLVG